MESCSALVYLPHYSSNYSRCIFNSIKLAMTANSYPPVSIFYGSQKGQAQAIAEEVFETARNEFSLTAELLCLSHPDTFDKLKKGGFVVFIVSTTGEGEPPDTIRKFWRILKDKSLNSDILSGLLYALLGLGDSNYENFCAMGKNLNQRLLSLAAKPFYEPGFADDGTGLEVVVDPWVDNLWQSFKSYVSGMDRPEKQITAANNLPSLAATEDYSIDEVLQISSLSIRSEEGEGSSAFLSASKVPIEESEVPLLPLNSISLSPIQFPHNYEGLTTPMLQPEYLHLEIREEKSSCPSFRSQSIYPHDTHSVCELVKAKQLTDTTNYSDVNKVMELHIRMNEPFGYQAGDAVGVLCPNDETEVEYLLERLLLKEKAENLIQLSLMQFNNKIGACIPPYIPKLCSVREVLLHHLDIRGVVRKSLLWSLAHYTTNRNESYQLAKLASKEGSTEYATKIRQQSATLMDILYLFPSCNPPLSRLIELLLPLNPRYYSICNSPLSSHNVIKIVFSLIKLENKPWHPTDRFGLCTRWLDRLATELNSVGNGVKEKIQLSVIARMVNTFHLPDNTTRPIIMVGPGTGVAPFIGFLEHRDKLHTTQEKELGTCHLYFGCRHSKGDFIFKEELDTFKTNNVLTEFQTSFSRDIGSPYRYVQDMMRENGKELFRLIREDNAVFYLCGDAKNMAPDVRSAWLDIFQKFGGFSAEEAQSFLKELQKSKQYLQDIWA